MATHFSEHIAAASTATVAPPTAVPIPSIKAGPGIHGAAIKKKFVSMDFTVGTLATGEEVRLFSMKSGDRIDTIRLTSDANFGATTTLTADLGLYEPGDLHDGAVVDIDLFVSLADISAGSLNRIEFLTESGTITGTDRGLRLWEMSTLGAETLTEDPQVDYDLVLTIGVATLFTGGVMLIEVEYTPAAIN